MERGKNSARAPPVIKTAGLTSQGTSRSGMPGKKVMHTLQVDAWHMLWAWCWELMDWHIPKLINHLVNIAELLCQPS